MSRDRVLIPVYGSNIKKRRKELGISSKDFASKLGVSATYWSQVENGHEHLSEAKIDQTAELLGYLGVAIGTVEPGKWFIKEARLM